MNKGDIMNQAKRILIMGLPGAGKTYIAQRLKAQLELHGKTVRWLNADEVRKECDDWDFSEEGRKRQALRMRLLADKFVEAGFVTVCDFVCPTRELRGIFDADFTVWMDTIPKGRFADTNSVFETPAKEEYDIRIDEFASDKWAPVLADLIHMLKED